MRILILHNRYRQLGGEDMVVAAETALLRARGHEVQHFIKDNSNLDGIGPIRLGIETIWSRQSHAEIAASIRGWQPDVAHFHNTLPLISPAAIHAANAFGVATVQTHHNYRLACPNAQLFRDGRPCEDCLGRPVAWPGVLHACYRESRLATGAVAAMNAVHRRKRTWIDKVDRHIALTEFARGKLVAAGLPPAHVVVKPNFLEQDPGRGEGAGGFALFVGRLSPEKGLRTLIAAWRDRPEAPPLKIVGDGPLAGEVAAAAAQIPALEWLGERPRAEVLELMGAARLVLVPSEWHEPFGLTIIEALARGTPVLGADSGGIASLLEDGRSGRLHRAGDAADLVAKQRELFALSETQAAEMRRFARERFENEFTAERNYDRLLRIYEAAIAAQAMRADAAGFGEGAPAGARLRS